MKTGRSTIIAGTLIVGCWNSVSHADRIYVPADYSAIQLAINAANAGDEIVVSSGVYNEVIDFHGKAIIVRSETGSEQTVIDGSGFQSSVVKFWSFESSSSVLDGFTIKRGEGTYINGMMRGGGILVQSSSPTIQNCIIKENTAGAGGGMAVWTGNPNIRNSLFFENSATATGAAGGGALHAYSGFPRLVNVEMRANRAEGSSVGGAMALYELSDAALLNCLIVDNTGRHTGGIQNVNSIISIYNCTIARNMATNSSVGHAMRSLGSSAVATILNSVIWANGDDGVSDEVQNALGEITIQYTCIAGGWDGEGNIDADPMFADPQSGDFRLGRDSQLVNRGSNDVLPSDIQLDLDGEARYADPYSSESFQPLIDLGPFEVQPDYVPGQDCPGDADGNGLVDVQDLLMVIANWGASCENCGSGCPGDADGDCEVDVVDLLAVIANWGSVCD